MSIQDRTQTTAEILAQLNAYEVGTGDNIWQDIILTLPDYDQDATEKLEQADSVQASDRFELVDGTIIRWDQAAFDGPAWCEDPRDDWSVELVVLNDETLDVDNAPAVMDTIGVYRNHALVDTVRCASAEDQEPYNTALREAGYGHLTGSWASWA